ncbi:MAG: HAD family hydrolase [Syntrophobacteraceae bacterium]|nr:HAD family hydrolase [Syntrophobacteraceae bacterium]
MKYKAVLFDLDGTLLDTIRDLAESMNEVLREMGLGPHSTEAYKYFVGDGMMRLVLRALPESLRGDETFVQAAVGRMRTIYDKRWRLNTRPYPGIPDLLDELAGRGIRMAVLSNKPDSSTKEMVRELLSRWHFHAVLGERPGVPRKPDPAGALEIVRTLSIPPEDFLYVGDTGVDMKTANRAGMFGVGALWGFRPERELRADGAGAVIERPRDLLSLLT